VVETALRGYLGRGRRGGTYRLHWKGSRGRRLPGIDLDDRDSLFDAMERRR